MQNKTVLQSIIENACQELAQKKDALLLQAIRDKVSLSDSFDAKTEGLRTFPRLKMIFDNIDMSEHWYWNDGSEKGLRLISFYPSENDIFSNEITIGFDYKP